MDFISPADRLIVAADFKPTPQEAISKRGWVEKKVLMLADALADTNIYLKVNSALRACGYSLIEQIHDRGLRVFADLKLFDIKETLATDGAFLRDVYPELLTVACVSGVSAIQALKAELPATEVLGVTVLTSFSNDDSKMVFSCSTEEAVVRLAKLGGAAKAGGLISSAKEVPKLREELEIFGEVLMTFNTPAIRPAWYTDPNDDQDPSRIVTPSQAISAGAHRIVVGRPIVRAQNPREAVLRTLEEISQAS